MKNHQAKTRPVDYPYEVYRSDRLPNWEWRVLKKYQRPDKESLNPLAIWHCAVKSPMTYGSWEYGDTYIKDITDTLDFVELIEIATKLRERDT